MLFRYLSDLVHAQISKWRGHEVPQVGLSTQTVTPAFAVEPQEAEVIKAPTRFEAAKGNITVYPGDAIVNAANSGLIPGGGVCGAIFAASDFDQLEEACIALRGCPTGEAKVTPSFGMPAPWIVHAVGPVWTGGDKGEPEQLAGAYRSALEQAHGVGARSIAFPAISTGIYGYPLADATSVAVETIRQYVEQYPDHFDAIDVLCFDDKTLNCYLDTMAGKPQLSAESSIGMTGPSGM